MEQEINNNVQSERDVTVALERNRELLERIYESTEKTRRYIFWIKVLYILKLVVIIITFVSVLFYMAPLLQQVLSLYTKGI